MGDNASPSAFNWRAYDLYASKWLPKFITSLSDPFVALRYNFDVTKQFLSNAVQSIEEQEPKKKHGSLRRAVSKIAAVGSSSSTTTRKARPGDDDVSDDAPAVRDELDTLRTIGNEVERIVRDLSSTVDAFVKATVTAGNVRIPEKEQNIEVIAPYVLLDCTITQHPRMKQLRLSDNRTYIEIGRAQLRSHIFAVTAAHGYGVEQAEKRLERALTTAKDWLCENFKEDVQSMLPVVWALDETSHEMLSNVELARRMQRITGEVPLIMIGVFHLMCMTEERDNVLESLLKFTF
jgi:hypothetical protein